MTPEKRETAIKWLQNEIRSLRLAPTINGCGPENWADLLEIMETCLEAVRAYPPAHIDREAWTAEWRELHGDKMVGLDDCGEDVYRHYHYSVCTSCGKGTAVKSNFCPSCGRAMTPEAWAELEKRLRR